MSFVVIGLGGCGYQPVDESVFDKTAEQLGRPPIENLIQLGDGRFTDSSWDFVCYRSIHRVALLASLGEGGRRCTSTLSMASSSKPDARYGGLR